MIGGSVNDDEACTPLKDKVLTCAVCSSGFVFTTGEQEFWAIKGFHNEPKRCADCRLMAKLRRDGNDKQPVSISCSKCSVTAIVPFKPCRSKPVYCHNCYCLVRHRERELTPARLDGIEMESDGDC